MAEIVACRPQTIDCRMIAVVKAGGILCHQHDALVGQSLDGRDAQGRADLVRLNRVVGQQPVCCLHLSVVVTHVSDRCS